MNRRYLCLPLLVAALVSTWAVDSAAELAVHEWGTFTSVQGADGVQMEWNPLVAPDLPRFVYDRFKAGNKNGLKGRRIAAKICMTTRQRMETPVIYFYTDRPRTADVRVKFPEGTITEWYPGAGAADLSFRPDKRAASQPVLHWPNLQVFPSTPEAELALRREPTGSHYYAARDTDAAILRFAEKTSKAEIEKFLFYRGVANFQAPLSVKLETSDSSQVTLENTGAEELRNFFLYQVSAEGGRWVKLERLAPGERCTLTLPSLSDSRPFTELAPALRQALVTEGLFEREATAMLNTWESSWFEERGLRVLYTLPREWTDRTLPLTITPAPERTARVMVARAEILIPEVERALLTQVERYIAAPAGELRAPIIAETRALGLGRFIDPARRRLLRVDRGKEFSTLAWELLSAASAQETQ